MIASSQQNLSAFSVLMSVYAKDDYVLFDKAMQSLAEQTLMPNEIVLVVDGPVDRLIQRVVDCYQRKLGDILKIVQLPRNCGLGLALASGLDKCNFEFVARMDADDISSPDRFEKQMTFLKDNPDIDVVSCFVAAFDKDIQKPLFVRSGPLKHNEIAKKFRFRFCMNHPASVMRKSTVLNAGNYVPFEGLEDYHLWARMLMAGAKMANINKVLYYHRWEKQLLKRRNGLKRAVQQIKLQREFLRIGFINKIQFVRNVIVRTIAVILPIDLARQLRIFFGI